MGELSGTVFLREKKVVLDTEPQREFIFLSKNSVGYDDGGTQHIYRRQRRGARATWIDEMAQPEPSAVAGDLSDQLERAYSLMEDEKHRVALDKFKVLVAKRGQARKTK
jgi:hypothetical protein